MRIVARRGGDKEVADPRVSSVDRQQPGSPAGGDRAGEQGPPGRWGRLRSAWHQRLEPAEQSVLIAWGAFTTTFVGVRLLTHWIRDGHGPSGGGVSVGGQHFHRAAGELRFVKRGTYVTVRGDPTATARFPEELSKREGKECRQFATACWPTFRTPKNWRRGWDSNPRYGVHSLVTR